MDDKVAQAVAMLRAGELVAFPTETVYGLGADASNPSAVAKIFAAKGRPADHPLIVHLADSKALDDWARDVPQAARQLAGAFWPGPLTLILKRQAHVLDAVTGGQDTVGLRMPDHPVALALLRAFSAAQGGVAGLAAPSANRYGRISPTCANHVRNELGESVKMILDGGDCAVGIESTIVDFSSGKPRILRPGAIGANDIHGILGTAPLSGNPAGAGTTVPRVAGSDLAHYAPRTPLRLVPSHQLQCAVDAAITSGQRVSVLALADREGLPPNLHWQAATPDAAAYAHGLYARLHELDARDDDLILVEAPPGSDDWLAVTDRLQRASRGSCGDDET